MPILAIDSMGNLYETDPDSSDGTGCKCAPPKSGGGDVALGKPYQDSENRRLRNEFRLQSSLALQDAMENRSAKLARRSGQMISEANDRRNFMAANPFNIMRLERQGLKQSLRGDYEDSISVSGTGLSANGLPGEAGRLNEDQLSTQAALTGKAPVAVAAKPSFWSRFFKPQTGTAAQAQVAKASIYKSSSVEQQQYAMNKAMTRVHEAQARQDAKRVAQEARDLTYNPSRDEDMVLYGEQRVAVAAPVLRRNPLLRMTRGY